METALWLALLGARVIVARDAGRGETAERDGRRGDPPAGTTRAGRDHDRGPVEPRAGTPFELARRLADTGVTANCLHSGFVRTALGRDVTGVLSAAVRLVLRFQPGPATGAETSVYLASSQEVAGVTGGYFVKCRFHPHLDSLRFGLAAAEPSGRVHQPAH